MAAELLGQCSKATCRESKERIGGGGGWGLMRNTGTCSLEERAIAGS